MKFVPDACVEVLNSLPLWVGQDLDPAARSQVERHLAECERCSTRAGAALRARTVLREQLASRAEDGPDVWPAVRATLRAEGRLVPRDDASIPFPARPNVLRLWPVAAIAAALLAIWVFGRWNDSGRSDAQSAPGTDLVQAPKATSEPEAGEIERPSGITFVNLRTGGLRRLNTGEAHLADEAEPAAPGSQEDAVRALSPVGLQRVVPNW